LIDVVASASTPVTCFGASDGVMEINVTDYTGNFSYEVFHSNGSTTSITSTGVAPGVLTISGLPAGNFYVELTATDTPFCPATSNTVTIASPAAALDLAVISNIPANCNIGAQVSVQASGGNGGYTYAFVPTTTSPTGLFTSSASAVLTPASYPVDYDVYVQDSKGCTSVITITVDEDPLPMVTLPAYSTDQCTST
uniref:hypothetical protein n=1 Tax=Arenibacter lacus TaxID=2608629 RepID=UPI00123D1C51